MTDVHIIVDSICSDLVKLQRNKRKLQKEKLLPIVGYVPTTVRSPSNMRC